MSSRGHFIVGLDIGSAHIKTIIAEDIPGESLLRVIGVGSAPSSGIRRGAIADADEALRAVNASLDQAEAMAGVPIEKVILCASGVDVFSQEAKGVIAVGKADGEVLEDDVMRVLHAAQSVAVPLNRDILHVLPCRYRLDDQKDIKDPVGMRGVRLEADALLVGGSTAHLKNLARCVEHMGIAVEGFVVEPLAAAQAVLGSKQKELGVVAVNIGSATTSIAVFEEGDAVHVRVLPVGASHITNDIAIGLRTSIEVAEQVKLLFGTALPGDVDRKEEIDLSRLDSQEDGLVSRHHVAEIIEARIDEILRLVNEDLRSIGRSGLLPAGVVLTGGGSKLMGVADMAKEVFSLPVQIGYPQPLGGILDRVDDPEFATAVGLVSFFRDRNVSSKTVSRSDGVFAGGLPENMQGAMKKMRGFFEKFLP
jgi:cell division protein FtsA